MEKKFFWRSRLGQNSLDFGKGLGKNRFTVIFSKLGLLKKFLVLLVLVALFSCASSPPPPPPQTSAPQTPASPPQPQKTPSQQQPIDFTAAKAQAVSAMDKAQSVKADVSVKARYNAAFTTYTEAESLADAGSASGIEKYLEAEKAFLAAYNEAVAKREEAQRQLTRARDAIKAVEDEAAEFDRQQAEDRRQGTRQ
jgi:hypothetical protein